MNKEQIEQPQVEQDKPQEPSSPGAFEDWYETQFQHGFERGPNDKYVARKAWFAALYLHPQQTPEGYKLLKDSAYEERSWPEDYAHENGNYTCSCCNCGRQFTGYKRRVTCKVCATTEVKP